MERLGAETRVLQRTVLHISVQLKQMPDGMRLQTPELMAAFQRLLP